MSENIDSACNVLIDAPAQPNGTTPDKDLGESRGYVDCSLYSDERMPLLSLKTIAGKNLIFNQMQLNSTISGILLAFKSLCQTPKLIVKENVDDPDRERAEKRAKFLTECLHDMQTPFSDVISEILDMLAMGFKVIVPQFKARTGYDTNSSFNSRYYDGKIGWKSFMPVDPMTIEKWNTPEGGGFLGLTGITQRISRNGKEIQIPRSRMLLFRTTSSNNDPTGKSLLEGAFLDWMDLIDANKIQMVGLRRSLIGIPYALIHSKMAADAKNNPAAKAAISAVKRTVLDIDARKDQGFILPADRDETGNLLAEVRLMGSKEGGGNSNIQDAKLIIDAKEQTIARSMLAQFMTIQGKGGSYALSKNQSEVFINSLKGYMTQIEGIMNGEAIPRLFVANKEAISIKDHFLPSISFSEFVKEDTNEFFTALQKSIEMGVFAVTPQIQNKAAQVLNVDLSGQKELLQERQDEQKEMKDLAKEGMINANAESSADTETGGSKDIPDTKATDITDKGLNDIIKN
jgi:hypothetical protein